MTRKALENGAAIVAATGGSTNAALHLPDHVAREQIGRALRVVPEHAGHRDAAPVRAHQADEGRRAALQLAAQLARGFHPHPGHGDPTRHEYRNVTPLSWGRRFHAPIFVSEPAMKLIAQAGGVE